MEEETKSAITIYQYPDIKLEDENYCYIGIRVYGPEGKTKFIGAIGISQLREHTTIHLHGWKVTAREKSDGIEIEPDGKY